jgi:hypothetical protein
MASTRLRCPEFGKVFADLLVDGKVLDALSSKSAPLMEFERLADVDRPSRTTECEGPSSGPPARGAGHAA